MRVVSARSKARSWLTSSTVPSNSSIASSSASMDSTSRWLVGSSKMRKLAPESIIMASATRAVSPPESDRRPALHRVPGESEAAEVALDRAAAPGGPEIGDDLVERAILRHLRQVLAVVGDAHRVGHADLTGVRCALAHDRAQERGLTGTVRAHQAHDLAAADPGGEVVEQRAALHLEPDVGGDQHLIAAALVRRETQRHRAFLARRRTEAADPVEPPPPALGLRAVLSRDVAADVILLRRRSRGPAWRRRAARPAAARCAAGRRPRSPRCRTARCPASRWRT